MCCEIAARRGEVTPVKIHVGIAGMLAHPLKEIPGRLEIKTMRARRLSQCNEHQYVSVGGADHSSQDGHKNPEASSK